MKNMRNKKEKCISEKREILNGIKELIRSDKGSERSRDKKL